MNKVTECTHVIPADTAVLQRVRQQVQDFISQTPFIASAQAMIVLAIDEAVSNMVQEKISNGRSGDVTMHLSLTELCLKVCLADSTTEYSVSLDDSSNVSRIRSYTLGIFLMRTVMDEVSYNYNRGFKNELTMMKFLPSVEDV